MMKSVQNHRGGVVDRRDPQGTRARIPNAPGHCGCPTKAPTHGFARGQPCAQSGQRVLLPPATAVAGPILEKGIRNLSRVLEGSTLSPAHGAPHIDELAKFPSQVRPYAALARLDKPIGEPGWAACQDRLFVPGPRALHLRHDAMASRRYLAPPLALLLVHRFGCAGRESARCGSPDFFWHRSHRVAWRGLHYQRSVRPGPGRQRRADPIPAAGGG